MSKRKFTSQAQQRYVFGVLAQQHPSDVIWAKQWAHNAGEKGGDTTRSRRAYAKLPNRVKGG